MEAIFKLGMTDGSLKYVVVELEGDHVHPKRLEMVRKNLEGQPRVRYAIAEPAVKEVVRYTENEALTEKALFGK